MGKSKTRCIPAISARKKEHEIPITAVKRWERDIRIAISNWPQRMSEGETNEERRMEDGGDMSYAHAPDPFPLPEGERDKF